MNLADIYRAFHPDAKEYTFFLAAHELTPKLTTFSDTKQVSTDTRKLK